MSLELVVDPGTETSTADPLPSTGTIVTRSNSVDFFQIEYATSLITGNPLWSIMVTIVFSHHNLLEASSMHHP